MCVWGGGGGGEEGYPQNMHLATGLECLSSTVKSHFSKQGGRGGGVGGRGIGADKFSRTRSPWQDMLE